MRRLAPLVVLAALLAGCGSGTTVSPTAETVVGTLPTTTTTQSTAATGNATAGKALFASKGCTGCHTFAPAGSNATQGPDLDKLADYAKTANRGSLQDFTAESIKDPGAYVQPGFSNIMPSFGLSDQQIADLTAYLTKG
jgi:mono/diheme cytochrome c family protein